MNKGVAHEVGRAMAVEADRVRGGVIDESRAKAAAAGRTDIWEHFVAWDAHLMNKGNTPKHSMQHRNRVEVLLELAGVSVLAEIAPERIQAALTQIKTPQTARGYLTALRGFVRWCCRTGRLSADPIAAVERPAVAGKTFRRQPISEDELEALLRVTATREARTPFCGVDRAMYYRLMAYTGLRRSEALSLTPESFMGLARGIVSYVVVEAAYSKHRRRDEIPLRRDLADLLRNWLKDKDANQGVFHVSRWANLNRIFHADCAAAGILPAPGMRLGIHSLRRFFITAVVRAGGLAVGQELARHLTLALTKEYTDLGMTDLEKGLAGLPPIKAEKKRGKEKTA
jgi:integrase